MAADPQRARTFLRIVEVWLPTDDGQLLELDGGIFGDIAGFEAMTRLMCFSLDEGLPGKTWASGAPVLVRPVEGSEFRRSRAVRLAGLRCTVALPIFHAGRLTSIVVLLFGESAPHRAAVEVWRDDALVDAHHGTADDEAAVASSRENRCGKETDRAASMRLFDDGCALSLSGKSPEGHAWIVDLAASKALPVALRMEIWSADGGGAGMARIVGWCANEGVLPTGEVSVRASDELGPVERAGRTGVAWAGPFGADGNAVFPFGHVLAIPLSREDQRTDVVALHF